LNEEDPKFIIDIVFAGVEGEGTFRSCLALFYYSIVSILLTFSEDSTVSFKTSVEEETDLWLKALKREQDQIREAQRSESSNDSTSASRRRAGLVGSANGPEISVDEGSESSSTASSTTTTPKTQGRKRAGSVVDQGMRVR
jgi:hypothetical protein